jgi:hypothetical protein
MQVTDGIYQEFKVSKFHGTMEAWAGIIQAID